MSLLRIACVLDANPNLVPAISALTLFVAFNTLSVPLAFADIDTNGFWSIGGVVLFFSVTTFIGSCFLGHMVWSVFIDSYRKLLRSERWGMSIRNPLIHS